MCLWMVRNGARYLVITSRSEVTTGYQRWMLERMKKLGACVQVRTDDICNAEQTKNLMNEALSLGPVGGVFHLAAVSASLCLNSFLSLLLASDKTRILKGYSSSHDQVTLDIRPRC